MKTKKSFTLIEMVIAIGLLAITLTATGGVLLSVVKSFQKQSALQRIERGGDVVLRTLEEKVRKAKAVSMEPSVSKIVGGNTYTYHMMKVVTADSAGVDKTEYLGVARRKVSTGVYINYFFVYPDSVPSGFPDIASADKYKITNDSCSNGVNIVVAPDSALPPITLDTSSNPTWVSATIEVELASCDSTYRPTGISKKFETLVTARGTYN